MKNKAFAVIDVETKETVLLFESATLAWEFVNHEPEEYTVKEMNVHTETRLSTWRTKKRIEEGKLEIRRTHFGKRFIFS